MILHIAAGGKLIVTDSKVVLKICWFRACGLLQDDHITILMFPINLGIFNSEVCVLGRLALSISQCLAADMEL